MFHKIALLLVIIGAINLGLVALVGVDIVTSMFGAFSHVISVLIGLSGMYMLLSTYTTLLNKPA